MDVSICSGVAPSAIALCLASPAPIAEPNNPEVPVPAILVAVTPAPTAALTPLTAKPGPRKDRILPTAEDNFLVTDASGSPSSGSGAK